MSNFTFLTEEQIFGSNQIDVIRKRGTKAAISDFSVLLGGWVSDYHVDNDSSLEGRTGWYWTKSDDGDNDARVVDDDGIGSTTSVFTIAMVGLAQLYRSHQSLASPRTERVGKKQEMVS